MRHSPTRSALVRAGVAAAVVLTAAATAAGSATATPAPTATPESAATRAAPSQRDGQRTPVAVDIVTPSRGDNSGQAGKGWIVDLSISYPGGPAGVKASGFTTPQLTGPATHNNVAPFPGSFSPGRDDRLPGLVVLGSTTTSTVAGFSGPGTNLANLFNTTGFTNRTARTTDVQDTWIVGAPILGSGVDTTLTVAVVADLDGNGTYDDAPAAVPDANGDGTIDAKDLAALGLASKVETVRFHLDGDA